LPRRSGLEALSLPLAHEFFILGGAGSRRRVGRKAAGPLRESIGDSGRELLVDAAASAQRARLERNGNDDGKMADADWHLRGVAIVRRWICIGLDRLRSIFSRWIWCVLRCCAALVRNTELTP